MVAALLDTPAAARPNVPSWQRLPPCMRVLYICAQEQAGGWLAEALSADSASKVVLEEAVGTAAGLARLRDEVFDAVLVGHEPGELDALDLVEGYRAGGAEEPIVVLGAEAEQAMAALCYEVGADGYVCDRRHHAEPDLGDRPGRRAAPTGPREPAAEPWRTDPAQRDHEEAACLLEQQRALLEERGRRFPNGLRVLRTKRACFLPELTAHYRELLRTYVIMGSGNLADELQASGRVAGRCRPDRSADLATPSGRVGRTGPRPGHAQQPARDDPRRSAGVGTAVAPGRRLPPPLSRTH